MREFIERSGGGGRVGIYREVDDESERWYVGKTATRPVVTITPNGTVTVDDLGRATISTSQCINTALRMHRGCGSVWRQRGKLRRYDGTLHPPHEPDEFGRTRFTFNLNEAEND